MQKFNIKNYHKPLKLILIVFTILVLGFFVSKLKTISTQALSYYSFINHFFTNPIYTLPSYQGHTNILLAGIGGKNHDGAELTDTLIFTSLNLENKSVSMISIPRDIWMPATNSKINSVYAIGKLESTEKGYQNLQDAIYEITNQPLHFIVIVDFSGFKAIVDALGGVKVDVDQSFIDPLYPIAGKEKDPCNGDPEYKCRYETLVFKKGPQTFDGDTALKFVRSRHAKGEEGTDYARSRRQQKVISAIKNKLLDKSTFLNPQKLLKLKEVFLKYVIISPKINEKEYGAFASFAYSFWRENKVVKHITLDQGDEENPGFLINPPIEKYNSWVLEPRAGNWQTFQAYLEQLLNQ